MKIWAFYSLKGGVGKTAAAVNITLEAAAAGETVLLWDLDPQGAASWYYGCDKRSKLQPADLATGKKAPGRSVQRTAFDRLSVLPADPAYRDWDVAIHEQKKPRKVLDRLTAPFSEQYSLLILDCPPSQGALATSILRAADQSLVPVVPTPLSLRALDGVYELVSQKKVGKTGVKPFFSMVDRRRKAHRALLQSRPDVMADGLDTVIDYSAHVEQMSEHRQPVRMFAPRSRAAQEFSAMAQELLAPKA